MLCNEREPSTGSVLVMAAAGPLGPDISLRASEKIKYTIGKHEIFQSRFNESDRPLLSMAVPEWAFGICYVQTIQTYDQVQT